MKLSKTDADHPQNPGAGQEKAELVAIFKEASLNSQTTAQNPNRADETILVEFTSPEALMEKPPAAEPQESEINLDIVMNDLQTSIGEEEIIAGKKSKKKQIADNQSEESSQHQGELAAHNLTHEFSAPPINLGAFASLTKPQAGTGSLTSFFDANLKSAGTLEKTEFSKHSYQMTYSQNVNTGVTANTETVSAPQPNTPPSVNDDAVALNQDSTSANLYTWLLLNDTDVNTSDILEILSVNTAGSVGSVTFNNLTQSIVYSTGNTFDALAAGVTAADSFTYAVSDGNGGTNTATVTVTVTGVNDPVTGNDDTATVSQDADSGNIYAALLTNDTDIDTADTLSIISIGTIGTAGIVVFDSFAQSIIYSTGNAFDALAAGVTAADSFTYTVSDGNGGTDTATVTVTVTGVNDAPVALDDGIYGETVEGGSTVLITAADLLLNDTDVDTGDTKTIVSMSAGAGQGTLANNGNGTWTYTPPADSLPFSGMATITYTVQDALGLTDTATVQLRVFNQINGTAGTDALSAADINTPHLLSGLAGNDTITGSNARDILDGGNGNDTLNAGDGDDDLLFSGTSGTDSVNGGNGYDRMLGSSGNDTIILSALSGIDYIDLGAGTNIIQANNYATLDFSNLTAGTDLLNVSYFTDYDYNETIIGTMGDDVFLRQSGWYQDIFRGGNGNDTFLVNGYAPEYDTFDGGNGYDQILGTVGNDSLLVNIISIEYIDLGAGTNVIAAVLGTTLDLSGFTHGVNLLGVNYITDDVSAETLIGTSGADTIQISVDWFSDTFSGGDGDDTFTFSGNLLGNDNINGGNGYDSLIGSAGNDALAPMTLSNIEYIDLGTGTNSLQAYYGATLDLSSYTSGVNLLGLTSITDNAAGETLIGTNQNDTIQISVDWFSDTFTGGDGDDTFTFSGNLLGNDNIDGGNGYDTLTGSKGDDTLAPMTLTGIEFIDLGTGTNSLQAYYGATLDLSSFTQGKDFLGVSNILDNINGETIIGTDQDDMLLLTADSWIDTLYGNDGADTFMINATRGEKDTLADFDVFEGDVIDISQVLSYNSALGDIISDFIQFIDSDGNPADGSGAVTMRVDADGTGKGHDFSDYFVFADQNMAMMDMIKNANLIVE